MEGSMNLKKTVNLPKTDFPMKANLPQSEPRLLERWESEGLYDRIREQRVSAPVFTLHDGPPYANGNIHLGTALNKILKDFIVKSKTMAGFNAPFVPGWDCHGLPIEIKVDQKLGAKKAGMQPGDIRRACREYAARYVDQHRRDFKRLGVLGRWRDPYLTMSASYEAVIAGAFVDFLDKGYVYKGLKPVHWCIHCRTALAEAEVEYHDHTSPSVWVKFPLRSDPAELSANLAGRRVSALIWTTTPWTLPANKALCFHPSIEYAAAPTGSGRDDEVLIIAQPMMAQVAGKLGLQLGRPLVTLEGSRLERAVFRHPFLDQDSVGVLGTHVTLEQGTGIVHTAPGHGQDDYKVGEKYHLETYCPVDGRGRFAEGLPEYEGKSVFEANPIIRDMLQARGCLLHAEDVEHSYPHCWRCRRPIIFRATEQWFIGMDQQDLRERALQEIKKVKWMPEWGMERISNMIATRPDWCISRQRVWGVPIVVFYCTSCDQMFTDRAALDHVVELFGRETSDVWFTKSPAELLPDGTACRKCGKSEFRTERDILDVWFDSGSSHLAVLGHEAGLSWPADLYIEGGDQYRGWFHSSLLVGVGLRDGSPYRQVATHGWVLDEKGRAMSKSLGNVIEPQTIVKSHGAEILRLWVASMDYRDDLRISGEMLTRLSDSYRKIRNCFRFQLANLYDFDPVTDQVPVARMEEADQWILLRMAQLVETCRKAYEEFAFHRAYHAIYNFCTVDLSSFYMDITKDRLYTAAATSPGRRSVQTALYRVSDACVRLIAPLLCFTAEEVWSYLPNRPADLPSVHMANLPEQAELSGELSRSQMDRLHNWDRLMVVRDDVLKALETARNEKLIGKALEARVMLSVEGDWGRLLTDYEAMLPMLFIVSQVRLTQEPLLALPDGQVPGLGISIQKAEGEKCERCWNYSVQVGDDKSFPTLCERCSPVVHAMESASV